MNAKPFRYARSDYWGKGHWLVHMDGTMGRVSRDEGGTWSAYDWYSPLPEGATPPPALAEGMTKRDDAARVLLAATKVRKEAQA
jgi:hypothetical protein